MAQRIFNRGGIYWANIDEKGENEKEKRDKNSRPKGSEEQKSRPGVIISNAKQNHFSNCVIMALITSQVDKIYPFEVEVVCEGQKSKILTDQIYTVDKID